MKNVVNNVLKPYKSKKLIVSVSGGIDSLVLLDILIKLKLDLVVVNFNHQQREQSLIEAKYIKNLCEKHNIPFEYFLLDFNVNENFQSAASKQRKEHLITVSNKYNTNIIITAHHLNDLSETVLLKLSRGSNLLGYAGMQQVYIKHKKIFIKPLLYVTKEDINNYAINEKVTYFTDESNLSLAYTRNKIRHNIIPYLIEDNPSFLNKITEYNIALSDAFKFIRKSSLKFLNGSTSFNIKELLNLDEAVKYDVIAYLLEENELNITREKITLILSFLFNSGPNATLDLGDNLQFKKEYDMAFISKMVILEPFKKELSLEDENVLPNGDVIIFNNKLNNKESININLCYNKKVAPLFARTRKDGDKLYFPYGHKKLKDFYIDQKIPLIERNNDILIVDKDDNILAVLGKYINNHKDLKDTLNLNYRRKQK